MTRGQDRAILHPRLHLCGDAPAYLPALPPLVLPLFPRFLVKWCPKMPFIPASDIITSSTAVTNGDLANNDYLLLRPEIDIISTAGIGIDTTFSVLRLDLNGHVFGASRAVRLDSSVQTAFDYTIRIGATGELVSDRLQALYVGSNFDLVDTTGNRISLINDGRITGLGNGAAFLFAAETASVVNGGTIESLSRGDIFNAALYFFTVQTASVINTGTIRSTALIPASDGGAVYFGQNSGTLTLVNLGTIFSPAKAIVSDATLSDSVSNFGTITGDVDLSDSAQSVVFNAGDILGSVNLRGGNDSYRAGADGYVRDGVFGAAGNDILSGGGLDDALYGGVGFDRLIGGAGDDVLGGGANNDTLLGGAGDDTLDGGDNTDLLIGGAGDDSLFGQIGFDSLFGGAGDDFAFGGTLDDLLNGGAGDDTLFGESRNDTLLGGKGDDSLDGGEGNDRLEGGRGDDTLTGGTGQDLFVFAPRGGADLVTDYVDGQDRIDLGAYDFTGFADMLTEATLNAVAGGVRIDFDTGDVVLLQGATLAGLTATDFLF